MIEVDDSDFTPDDYDFLKEWAETLRGLRLSYVV
jgi:hypothetical protein